MKLITEREDNESGAAEAEAEAMKADFAVAAVKMGMKIRPKFGKPFLFICKVEKSEIHIDTQENGTDVVENSSKRTKYRHFPTVEALAKFYNDLKREAKNEKEKGITTKLSPVTAFIQDENNKVIGVEKYGDYGLQEWKVEPGDKE